MSKETIKTHEHAPNASTELSAEQREIAETLKKQESELTQETGGILLKLAEKFPSKARKALLAFIITTMLADMTQAIEKLKEPSRAHRQEKSSTTSEVVSLYSQSHEQVIGTENLEKLKQDGGSVALKIHLVNEDFHDKFNYYQLLNAEEYPVILSPGTQINLLELMVPSEAKTINELFDLISPHIQHQRGDFDSYNNHIWATPYPLRKNTDSKTMIRMKISPSYIFRDNHPDAQAIPINIDLSDFGYGKIENAIYVPPIDPIDTIKGYHFYSNKSQGESKKVIEVFPEMAAATAEIETAFGVMPGNTVKRFYVVESDKEGAYVDRRDISTIIILDERLKSEGFPPADLARHEAIHAIDEKLKLSKSSSFASLYHALIREANNIFSNSDTEYEKSLKNFFKNIDEEHFLPNATAGGHSHESIREFLASFINTLFRKNWENKMQNMNRDFQERYSETLLHLQRGLAGCNNIPSDAPIFDVIEERTEVLNEMLGVEQ